MDERIDIEAYTQIFEADDGITDEQLVAFGLSAIAELKRTYEKIDLLKAENKAWQEAIQGTVRDLLIVQTQTVVDLMELWKVTNNDEVLRIAKSLGELQNPL